MAISEDCLKQHTKSIQNVLFQVRDAVVATSTENIDPVTTYTSQDVDEDLSTDGTFYVGKMKTDGTWLIQKTAKISPTEEDYDINFANVSNNGTYTDYASAWTNRLTLTYEKIDSLLNV